MEESDFSATPMNRSMRRTSRALFFKSLADQKLSPPASWSESAATPAGVSRAGISSGAESRGKLAGYTIGNDMSSRDIEGENLLYLPQAKIYDRILRRPRSVDSNRCL